MLPDAGPCMIRLREAQGEASVAVGTSRQSGAEAILAPWRCSVTMPGLMRVTTTQQGFLRMVNAACWGAHGAFATVWSSRVRLRWAGDASSSHATVRRPLPRLHGAEKHHAGVRPLAARRNAPPSVQTRRAASRGRRAA